VVLPIVIAVIFGLLYVTYRSALEALHVLVAVPFALSGGVLLVWLLGYNFSVAVWVGFIALFGTAVQTAVVMVIYLDEAVARRRAASDGPLSRSALREAVMEGALLRLRPKVMTVSTVVAGLLPIMWSTRVGAEVMKPLAAPVLGGMVSSLLLVLIVTPVLYCQLRERELVSDVDDARVPVAPVTVAPRPTVRRRARIVAVGIVAIVALTAAGWWLSRRPPEAGGDAPGRVLMTIRANDVAIAVVSDEPALRQGRNVFALEFRSGSTNALMDVGDVRLMASMSMAGMVMPGVVEISRTQTPGRYAASGEFGMAGQWRMTVEWNGPAGRGTASFDGEVR
jgi:hypothetical protein